MTIESIKGLLSDSYEEDSSLLIKEGVMKSKESNALDRQNFLYQSTTDPDIQTKDDSHHTNEITDDYQSKWKSSQDLIQDDEGDHEAETDNAFYDISFSDDDELPVFADEECRRLHRLTKELERERDEAAKSVKENKERISVMQDHLDNVRQEIDHTNGLVAAKNNEIATEKHLIALGEREMAVMMSDVETLDANIAHEKERLRSIQNRIHVATDEREKLKLDLNWNQEELEQWATAAAKKEGDTLALQKYTRADEVMIKELTLTLENMSKKSVEKKAQLENEITETKAKQLEVDRLAKAFRLQHDERRLLVQQWQDTVNAMKDRDRDINELSTKYADAQQIFEKQLAVLAEKKEMLGTLKGEKETLVQEIEATERMVQNKRQERLSTQSNLQTFQDEMESLKLESLASTASLEQKKQLLALVETEVEEKMKQLGIFRARYAEIKARLEEEEKVTLSREKLTRSVEERLLERDKELKEKEHFVQLLKQQMFKDSQTVAQLRQKESNTIADIRSTQASGKILSSKINQLNKERSRQQELLYNAEFQLQQMERKVARGLGERSDEEKKQLQQRIAELEEEHGRYKSRQVTLLQQGKKLQQELQKWQKKREVCENDQRELKERIGDVELEISAYELNLKKIIARKEEEMVSHDLVRLEVRRLRDLLTKKIEEVIHLENSRNDILSQMSAKKADIKIHTEVKIAQLRAYEDERHKCAVELGQRKIAAEKIQLKHESITKAHGNDDTDDAENSPVYHLITAAQKRAELQRQGDALDSEIRNREKELKTMEKTLTHLRERNTDFRSSFTKVDKKSKDYQEVIALDEKVKFSEKKLLEMKKEFQQTKKKHDDHRKKIEPMQSNLLLLNEELETLNDTRSRVKSEIERITHDIENARARIKEQSSLHRQDHHHSKSILNENEESLQELLFRAEIIESHSAQIISMLVELGREFPDIRYSIMESLSQEKLEVQF